MVKNRTEILFFCASNSALSHTFLEKSRRRPPKSPVPEPKTRLCKTLIIIGVGNVAVLVHLNNQPISQKGGF